jgi:nitrate reductase beta subunit
MKNKLRVKWSKKENDFLIYYPRKCDGHLINDRLLGSRLIYNMFKESKYEKEISLVDELERRGYNLKTMKFEISLKDEEKD